MKAYFSSIYRSSLYLLALLAVGLFGCSEDELESLDPKPAFSVAEGSSTEVFLPVQFSNESTDAYSYLWSFGDGKTVTGKNPTHIYEAPGEYTVTLEASATGNRAVVSKTITIAPTSVELYYIDNTEGAVMRLPLNNPSQPEMAFELPGFSFGLAYDEGNQELYYTDDDAQALYKNNLQGSAEQMIAEGFNSPRDIALDTENNRVFVVDRGADAVIEINLADNARRVVFSSDDNADFLLPVAVDFHDGQLYMTCIDFDAETVWKGNAEGTGLERIIDYFGGGFGYALEVDPVNEKVYFDDNDGGSILRANLDGTGVEQVLSVADRSYGIGIDQALGVLYVASRDGRLQASNLDGSETVVIQETGNDVRGMVVKR